MRYTITIADKNYTVRYEDVPQSIAKSINILLNAVANEQLDITSSEEEHIQTEKKRRGHGII